MSVFTGCKSNPKPKVTPKVSKVVSNHIDLKGRVIKILNYGVSGNLVELYKNEMKEQAEIEKIKKIQEDYNCTFEFVKIDQSAISQIAAGQSMGDFMPVDDASIYYYNRDGNNIFLPLDDYSDILELNNTSIWNTVKQEQLSLGKVTQVVCTNDNVNTFYNNSVMFFNITMLKEAGLWDQYNLYEMQKSKTWNWEVFKELCTQITKDTDSDGKIDRHGMLFSYSCLNAFAVSNGNGDGKSSLVTTDDNGKSIFAISQPAQKETYNLFSSLHRAGSIRTLPIDDQYQLTTLEGYDEFVKGEVLFNVAVGYRIRTLLEDMKDEWGVVGIPLGPKNTQHEYHITSDGTSCWGILKNAENPEALAYILKEFMTPVMSDEEATQLQLDQLTKDGINSSVVETVSLLTQPALFCMDNTRVFANIGATYPYFQEITKVFNKNSKEKDFFTVTVPEIQARMDEIWSRVINNIDLLGNEKAD